MNKKIYAVVVACLLTTGVMTPKAGYAAMAHKYRSMANEKMDELNSLKNLKVNRDFFTKSGLEARQKRERLASEAKRYRKMADNYERMAAGKK